MKRNLFVFAVVFLLSNPVAKLEAQQVITQLLPHFVAGSLPASDWESKILVVNLAGSENAVVVDFFDNAGNPLAVSTNKGTNSSFVVTLPKPEPDSVGSEVLEIFRNTGSFVTGWAKIRSSKPFGADLGFTQFAPGGIDPIGKADVPPSPAENVLTYPLAPNNGVALVNPGSQSANVNFTAFDRAGNKIREGKFSVARGEHKAMFFNQEPFFLEEKGIIVIASNIPLSGIAMEFDGLVFKTVPRIPTPRRLDSKISASKIGFVYIYDENRQPQPDIQKRLAEYVGFQQALLDKEMLLNGHNRVQLPYDLDQNGLPKVEIINAGSRDQYFDYTKTGFDRIRWELFQKQIDSRIPSDWAKKVVFVDMWLDRVVEGQSDDIVVSGGGDGSWLTAIYLPFLKKSYFGDKRRYVGVPIPEFGGKPLPQWYGGARTTETFENLADRAIETVNHENGHSFWYLGHSDAGEKGHFLSMVSGRGLAGRGCVNPTQPIECILLPAEAQMAAIGEISRPNDFGWVQKDSSYPEIEVLSYQIVGTKLKANFRAKDLESGINSISIQTYTAPWTAYWRAVSHSDDLDNMTIETEIGSQPVHLWIEATNNQGQTESKNLF